MRSYIRCVVIACVKAPLVLNCPFGYIIYLRITYIYRDLFCLQWVDTERLEHWLKRIYNSSEDDEDGGEGVGGDLPKVVKGVVKTLLHERRVSSNINC